MKTTVQLLEDTRALLVNKGWTQRAGARDSEGVATDHRSPGAECFCLGGAMERAAFDANQPTGDAYGMVWVSVERFIPQGLSVSRFNDAFGMTKEMILEVVDKAIDHAKHFTREIDEHLINRADAGPRLPGL